MNTKVAPITVRARFIARGDELLNQPLAVLRITGNAARNVRVAIAEKVAEHVWVDWQDSFGQGKGLCCGDRVITLVPGAESRSYLCRSHRSYGLARRLRPPPLLLYRRRSPP